MPAVLKPPGGPGGGIAPGAGPVPGSVDVELLGGDGRSGADAMPLGTGGAPYPGPGNVRSHKKIQRKLSMFHLNMYNEKSSSR